LAEVVERLCDFGLEDSFFVEGLGLTWNPLTTQIESHDWQAELYSDVARFNRIAHNLATDVWTYISLGYFHQRLSAQGSTGSSTMPHKVNPIRFENGEANLEISCSLLDTLAATLVTSRLQRDLTDSTTQRNVGVALGHSLLAVDNIRRGLAGLDVDRARLEEDLEATWEVLGEPVQQAMRAAAIAALAPVIRRFMWGASFRRWCYFNPVRAMEPTIWRWNAMNRAMRGTSAIVVAAMT